MKTIDLPPHAPTLIESTRAIGYTLEAAIADLIDNSISASASSIDILYFPTDDPYIAILDDGCGMNDAEINSAMRYGSKNPNEKRSATDLGRFGLGLKTASLSQCRTLTVVSKKKSRIVARRWDIDHVIEAKGWSLLALDAKEIKDIPHIDELKKRDAGTLVVWQNLDRLKIGEPDFGRAMSGKMDKVREHLALVFHRYLSGEEGLRKMQIKMNHVAVEPADPFLTRQSTQVMDDEKLCIEGMSIVVRPHILPHISMMSAEELKTLGGEEGLRRSQGFYVYRNKRLLVWGTWFRMMRQGEHSKLARILVDIPNELDNLWTLDIKKSTAIPPEVVRQNLKSILERMGENSKRTWTVRGEKETRDSVVHVWKRFEGQQGDVSYRINRDHPLVQLCMNTSPQAKRNMETLLKAIENGVQYNRISLDLFADAKIEEDAGMPEHEVENALKILLDSVTSEVKRTELLESLSATDPFVDFPEIIKKYRKGGMSDGRK